MKVISLLDFRWTIGSGELKPGIILLMSALVITLHRYFGSVEFAYISFPGQSGFTVSLYMFISAFLMMFVLPVIIIRAFFNEPLSDYGFRIGDWKTGSSFILYLLPVITILLLYPAANTKEMIDYYPLDKGAGSSAVSFVRFEFVRVALFYTAWEFFFRGFMLFGLRKYMSDWLAICCQTLPSCLWHIGMPAGEILSSILGGILFGVMALRTGSIIYPFILHAMIGILLDLLIVIRI